MTTWSSWKNHFRASKLYLCQVVMDSEMMGSMPFPLIACSERNTVMLTLDGVDVMGERLAEKVLEVIKRKPGLNKISFLAHSVGRLVARFAIGKSYRPSKGGSMEQVSTNECKEESKGLIADLEPVNFITVATPHLGSRGNKQNSNKSLSFHTTVALLLSLVPFLHVVLYMDLLELFLKCHNLEFEDLVVSVGASVLLLV